MGWGIKRNLIRAFAAVMIAAASVFLAAHPKTALASYFTASGSDPITIADGVSYDPATRDYVYDVDSKGTKLHCTALDGMVVSDPVTVSGAGAFLYRNGEEYSGSLDPVSEPGEYVVMMNASERNTRVLAFTIVGSVTNTVHTYKMPAGMIVNEIWLNDEEIPLDYRSVSMEREGTYRIVTECIASGIVYTLKTTVDRTPPQLVFEGAADSRGRYGSAVTISGLEKDEKISLTRDGVSVTPERETDGTYKLVDSGEYEIIAYDEAGNMSEYRILIMAYLNASGLAFVVLLVIVIAAVVIYVIVKRRKLRIG